MTEDHDASTSTRHDGGRTVSPRRDDRDRKARIRGSLLRLQRLRARGATRRADSCGGAFAGCGIRDSDSKARDSGPGIRDSKDSKFIAFPARPAWQRPSVVLPWAAAATLALTVGYQSLVTVPGLREATSTQALSPVMLRGATRGAVPVVTVSPGQRFVTLAMDVMTSSSKELRYDLLDEAGNTLLSGRTPLPLSGAPLYLLISADELGRQGRHTLIVRDPDSSGAVLGEYGFDVAH